MRLSNDDLAEMHKNLTQPGPNDREYGLNGKITTDAAKEERKIVEAQAWEAENDK